MAAHLGIHVLGPRYGESIILELPDGGVGVIDSFAPRTGPHPVLAFLESRFPRLPKLRFFGVTHPHADHCMRAAEVFDRYPPDEVWMFRPFPAGQLRLFIQALRHHGGRDAVEAALGLPAGSVAASLLQLQSRVTPRARRGSGFRYFAAAAPFTMCGGRLRLHFLAPNDAAQMRYAAELEHAERAILLDGPAFAAAGRLPQPDHNVASAALLIEFGTTRVLLTSDAEGPRWQECLGDSPPRELSKPVHFVKASHHGSETGYLRRLYDLIGDPGSTVAVITPFHHGSVHLPLAEGVRAIRPHVRDVYCTSQAAASASTRLTWECLSPLPAVPPGWLADLMADRHLYRLLVPAVGGTEPAERLPPLPATWVDAIATAPGLARLLRPELRPPGVISRPPDAHVVSASYDDAGNQLSLGLGPGAGRLAA